MTRYTYEQMLEAMNRVGTSMGDDEREAIASMIVEVVNDPGLSIADVLREAVVLDMIQGR